MKNIQLAILCFMFIAKGYGQIANSYGSIVVEITKEKKSFSTKVEVVSAFQGGDSSWVQMIEKNINQSLELGKRVKKGKYIVSVKFILTRDGSLSDIRCENNTGSGMCDEVVRVIKKSQKSQKWIPAVLRTNNIPD